MNIGRIAVFAGPSLPPAYRPAGPFEWFPPATAGDVLAALDRGPSNICLIDGFFDSRPAPWHKELLVAMEHGVRVLGASSMGALRAAELERFGMTGVGTIFGAYRDARLRGDDEVALVHATERLGWAPLSVPMVEMRATLAAACRAGILSPHAARQIRGLAHDIHLSDRDWPRVRKACSAERLAPPEALRSLEAAHVPLKRRDALDCLAAARSPLPDPARIAVPRTCFLSRLECEVAARRSTAAPAPLRRPVGTASRRRQARDDGA